MGEYALFFTGKLRISLLGTHTFKQPIAPLKYKLKLNATSPESFFSEVANQAGALLSDWCTR
jgi:hypothetical protein